MNEAHEKELLRQVYLLVEQHRLDNALFPGLDKRYFVMDQETAKCLTLTIVEHLIVNGYGPGPDTPAPQAA